MNDIKKKYLPIGSIVNIDISNRKIMITGFYRKDSTNNFFDYSGCTYPEGILDNSQEILFNHSQIKALLYSGMISEEETMYKEKLKAFIDSLSNTVPEPSTDVSNNSTIAVLDINNIDLSPSTETETSSSTETQETISSGEKSKDKPHYIFGPDGVIIGVE